MRDRLFLTDADLQSPKPLRRWEFPVYYFADPLVPIPSGFKMTIYLSFSKPDKPMYRKLHRDITHQLVEWFVSMKAWEHGRITRESAEEVAVERAHWRDIRASSA